MVSWQMINVIMSSKKYRQQSDQDNFALSRTIIVGARVLNIFSSARVVKMTNCRGRAGEESIFFPETRAILFYNLEDTR